MKAQSKCSPTRPQCAVALWALIFALCLWVSAAWAIQAIHKGERSGLYDWAEDSGIVVLGTVVAASDDALKVEVERVLRGSLQLKRIAVTPSLVSDCKGAHPALGPGERGAFFIKGIEDHKFVLAARGAVLNMRFEREDALPGIRRLLEIVALPEQRQRQRAMIDLLDSKNRVLRHAARDFIFVHVIVANDRARFVPLLLSKLSSRDPEARQIAIGGLEGVKNSALIKPLVKATRDPDIRVVSAASMALGKFNTDASIRALLRLLKHPNPEARIRACIDLQFHPTRDVVTALIETSHDPVARVRTVSVLGLGISLRERKSSAGVPRLREMLRDPDPEVRGRAASALGEARDPNLVHTLLNMLGDKVLDGDLECSIMDGLSLLPWNDATVRAALSERVSRLGESLRKGRRCAPCVAGLLVSAHTPKARGILEDVARNHPRPDVRERAAVALKQWDSGT
jgi:HEAT repeat protein